VLEAAGADLIIARDAGRWAATSVVDEIDLRACRHHRSGVRSGQGRTSDDTGIETYGADFRTRREVIPTVVSGKPIRRNVVQPAA
jgi:hypothetical protein